MLNRILVIVGLLLLCTLLVVWSQMPVRWIAPAPVIPPLAPEPLALEDQGFGHLSALAVLERPVFWEDRRPSTSDSESVRVPAGNLQLLGLIRLSSGEYFAIIRTAAGVSRIGLHGSAGGWQFSGVEDEQAVFVSVDDRGRRLALELPRNRVAHPSARPVPVDQGLNRVDADPGSMN